jgi:putative hydrolase of the HAD superfamily
MQSSAVIFDLDGTIHDRAQGIQAFASNQFNRLGTNPSLASKYTQRFVELDANGMVWKDKVYEVISKEFVLVGNPSIENLVNEYIELYPSFSIEIEGSTRTIKALRSSGIKVGILTNGPSTLQRSVISSLGFEDIVDAVVISEEVGFRKPQNEIYSLILSKLSVVASHSVMVGDSLEADIEGALAAGLHPVAFKLASVPKGVPSCSSMPEVMNVAQSILK